MFSNGPLYTDELVLDGQLGTDTGCSQGDIPESMHDRDEWQGELDKSVRAISHDR